MTWLEFVYQQIVDYCNTQGSRTFSLQGLLGAKRDAFWAFRPTNRHAEDKVRQQLQILRDEGRVTFLDYSGHYTLRGIDLLTPELEETASIDLRREQPEKREYVVETYVRNVMWARQARQTFGDICLCRGCTNTFRREDGTRYIEVHHIVPLCRGGEDGLWNLSVLCAHHHRMAHFADESTKADLIGYLLREVRGRLG